MKEIRIRLLLHSGHFNRLRKESFALGVCLINGGERPWKFEVCRVMALQRHLHYSRQTIVSRISFESPASESDYIDHDVYSVSILVGFFWV